jgi:hypothetical protein
VSWKKDLEFNETVFAKPLVHTPRGYTNEQVIVVSSLNIVRVIDGLTGSLLRSRTLVPPFQAVDAQCTEAGSTIGITGTPIIDAETGVLYLCSKGYKGGMLMSFCSYQLLTLNHRCRRPTGYAHW